MAFVKPNYSKGQVNRAGQILAAPEKYAADDQAWADAVLTNWRACHGYPINTFQATLRNKLRGIDAKALVAQRMKRTPSIVFKLRRFEDMKLARMQDIGGLRAVLDSVGKVRKLEAAYRNANFQHQLVSSKDYINEPKPDGYRGIHLIYRYANVRAPEYDGLGVELQMRTRLQHAWATAVETMGTFLGQALKSGQGDQEWREFFSKAGAALAIVEKCPPVPGFEGKASAEVYAELAEAEHRLRVLEKLNGFAIAADKITSERGQGAYHLIILDSAKRAVFLRPYPISRLEQANLDYAEIEKRTNAGEPIEAVLVSAGPIDALRKAYPNYFLDTQAFVAQISKVIAQVG
ncbi:RelA/SpoT domain-containing protein [Paraburkholderia antibiotica]|uniref:RelA/SpoT domain-containing protein n=1 Tax=Paraburkholderia antibiotica TaxID=2728839 RepID=A0A7X9ZV78_9BURK|nr:RelA/SpoT domain-containing protein [Paraburkholderia antibiotica]NML29391.1 RelA/SpoT domain-containing protein [Paraburkholderia antibiotica]